MSSKVGLVLGAQAASTAAKLNKIFGEGRSVQELARLAWAVSGERRALAKADEAMLRDLGLTAEEAAQEASRPFWDLPRAR